MVSSGSDDGFIADTFHHVAVVRDGNTFRVFLDGVETATADATGVTIHNSTTALAIGALSNTGGAPMGEGSAAWIDELRITQGVARYTGNFTPPTAAFPRF